MVKMKDTAEKVTAASRKITITGVSIVDGQFIDENGSIADRVAESIPSGIDNFDISIKINFPVCEDDEEADADELAPDED